MADLIRTRQDPADWFGLFEDLALTASVAPAESERACIETLLKLLTSTPVRARSIGCHEFDPLKLFALLDAGAGESAVLRMIPASAGVMVSRGCNDRHVASIFLPISIEQSTSAGHTFALAVISAFALAIAESRLDHARAGMAGSKSFSGINPDRNSRLT